MTAEDRARAVAISVIILISMVAGGTVVSGTAEVEDEPAGTAPDSITQESGTEKSIEYGTNLSKAVRAVSTPDQASSATADSEESSAVTAQNVVIQNKIASDDDDSLSDLSSADPVRLQVKFSDSADVDETVAEIEEVGTVLREFGDIGYASVLIELGDVPQIERIDGVEAARLEPTASRATAGAQQATLDNESASRQEPSHAWESMNSYSDADLLHDLGYNGSGVTVAVIDTGVTETGALRGKIADQRDFTTGARSNAFDPTGTDPTDYFGHGSNVAGIIAASDTVVEAENRTELASGNPISTSNSETYETEGVAPGANLLNAKVFQLLETNRGGPVTETLRTNETERVDINNFDRNAQYLRVEAEWADPNDNVTVELIDSNGNVVDTAFDGNGYQLSPETTESGNKTVIHLNTTGGMFANIDAVRLTGDSVSGETDVDVTYRQFNDLAYSGDIAEAIQWSTTGTDAGDQASPTADVISTSIAASSSQPVREAAIEQAVENGSLYVSSAGNGGVNNTISTVKQRDDVITVGAIDRDGSIAEFSQPGPSENKPDLVAPGVAIPSAGAPDRLPAVTGFDNNGTVKSGTSMSTPYVSGAAALYIDAYRDMYGANPSPEEIKAALTAGAVDSREDPAFNSAGDRLDSFSAQPTDLPLADGRDDRYGAGTVNPYNSYVAFVASGQGDETVTVDTDGLTTVPPADQSARNARPQKAVLSWVDGTSDYGLSSSTAGSASGPGAERIIVETPSGQTTTYSISETASGSEEWAFGVTAPILDTQAQGWSGDGYAVTAEPGQSLEANESAAYAVPVDRTLVTGFYADDIGPIRVQSYENGPEDLNLYLYDGTGSLMDKSTIGEPDVEQVIGDNRTAAQGGSASKVVFASNFSNGSSAFTAVHNYPLEPLPSEASVTVTDSVAGNASDPGSVALKFTVETAGRPYTYGGFGQPDESHVEVVVGNRTVNNVSLSEADGRQDKYRVEFVAPVQQTTGDYDVSVSFTDEKYGTSHTAETTAANAIEYTEGGGATGSTATAIIIDESGSMGGGQKIENAKQSAKEYVSLLGPGDYATVIGFDSGARTPAPMQRTTTANKSNLRSGIDRLSAGGGTDIGDGMREAFPEFDKAPENATKAAILLGDGRAGYPGNQVQTYNNSEIPVCTIALGSNADRDTLERIAENTGCELREASSSNLQEIYNELNQNITGSSTIDKKRGTVGNNSTAKQRFRLDRSVDNTNVRVNIGSSSGSATDASTAVTANDGATTVRLLYPNGTVVPLNSSSPTGTDDPSITYNDLGDTTIYQLDDPEPGEWTTEIRNQQSSPVSYSSEVTASASATLSARADGREFVNGSTTTVSATLVNDQGGISGATVTANVTRPDGSTDPIQLNETSSGTYRGQVVNEDDGTVSATVTAASRNFSRQTSLSWSVVDQSSVLQTSVVNNTTATTAEGGSVDVAVNVTRPAGASATSATASTDASAETDTAESAFMAQVREVAASEPGTYDPADVDPAVLTAARALQNESNQATEESINETLAATDATSAVSATTSASAKPVFVSASELTAQSGATISESAVQTSPSVVSLQTGAAAEVTVSVQVPDSASPGVYNGTMTAVIDGTVVQTAYAVNVTEATATTYENRIQRSAGNWAATTSPNGKSYYETQMADQLTNRYFEVDNGSASTDSDDESTTADAIGGVNVGVVR